MIKTFEEENNEILDYILYDRYWSKFTKDNLDYQQKTGRGLEIYITSVCNQKCEYCYLARYGDELYPPEIRNIETILNNITILLNYLIKNHYYLDCLDLFSGEIWGMQLGNNVFDRILTALDNGLHLNQIMIPSNCSFVLNEKITQIIQAYIEEFKKRKVRLIFSASVDGKIIEELNRPTVNNKYVQQKNSEEYYEKLFSFCLTNGYGFHPMVAANSIEHWCDNFDWWIEKFETYKLNIFNCIMMLEVRNNDWTEEKIISYLKFLKHSFNYFYYDYYQENIEKMIQEFFLKITDGPSNYQHLTIAPAVKHQSCAIPRVLTVRAGDLAICPCHRLSYDKFLYGKFKVENNEIIGVEAKNIQMANKIYYTSCKHIHECDSCNYNNFCMRGCFGAQYESEKDPFIPIPSVCFLFKAKFNYLIYLYETFGILDYLKQKSSIDRYAKLLVDYIKQIQETQEYKQWIKNNIHKI